MQTVIKTPEELLDLRNRAGAILCEGDLIIECDIPWVDVGVEITKIEVNGDLYCHGDLYCNGNLYCHGSLICKGDLHCRGDLYCYSGMRCYSGIYSGGDLR